MNQKIRTVICLLFLAVSLFIGVLQAAERKALVIGNNNYANVSKLRNAKTDAEALAKSLRELGFKVTLQVDLDERGMRGAIRNFVASLDGGDEAIFYYAGHGVQLGAANYLLPVDIQPTDENQIRDEALALQRVLDDLTERRVRFSIAIIDACRDNPFPKVAGRSIGTTRGLAPTNPATGQMVLFSAGAGQSALDSLSPNDRDPNGLFTRVLLRKMREPGVTVDQVLRNVREEVVSLARGIGHEQVPALYDQSIGRFYFKEDPNSAMPRVNVSMAAPIATNPGTNVNNSRVVTQPNLTLPTAQGTLVNQRDATRSTDQDASPTIIRLAVRRFISNVDEKSWRNYLDARPSNLEQMIETQSVKVGKFQVVSVPTQDKARETIDYFLDGAITEFSQDRHDLQTDELATSEISTTLGVDVRLIRAKTGEIITAESIVVRQQTAGGVAIGTIRQSGSSQSPLSALQRRAAKLAVAALTQAISPIQISRISGNEVSVDQGESIFSVDDEIIVSGDDGIATLRIIEASTSTSRATLVRGKMPKVGDAVRVNFKSNSSENEPRKRFGREI